MQWQGSSPLAQGTHLECTALSGAVQAHPRSRGEHFQTDTTHSLRPGSSPLARGTLDHESQRSPRLGLIPARAGNTNAGHVYPRRGTVHPRSRGEHVDCSTKNVPPLGSSPLAQGKHILRSAFTRTDRGSSPLTRGTPRGKDAQPLFTRLIPARTGNTILTARRPALRAAHPRSRGEHQLLDLCRIRNYGSSPLA